MRIIAGKYRSISIIAPSKLPVRPTTNMAKEALFNIITNHFDLSNIRVLDLFAGIGSISFEFASRGCENITVIEMNKKCVDFISKTATKLDCKLNIQCFDVLKYLNKNIDTYDLIFADPPFRYNNYEQLISLIFEKKIMSHPSWFILEHSKYNSFVEYPLFKKVKEYGNINFSIFENK